MVVPVLPKLQRVGHSAKEPLRSLHMDLLDHEALPSVGGGEPHRNPFHGTQDPSPTLKGLALSAAKRIGPT